MIACWIWSDWSPLTIISFQFQESGGAHVRSAGGFDGQCWHERHVRWLAFFFFFFFLFDFASFFSFFSDDTKFSLFNGPLHPAAKWNQNWNTSSKWNSIESTLNTSYSQRHYLIQLASNRWHSKWCLVNIKKSPPPKKTDAQPTTDDLLSTALAKNSWTAFVDCHLFRSLRVFGP